MLVTFYSHQAKCLVNHSHLSFVVVVVVVEVALIAFRGRQRKRQRSLLSVKALELAGR